MLRAISAGLGLALAFVPLASAPAQEQMIPVPPANPVQLAGVNLRLVFRGEGDEKAIFSPEFLRQVPIAQIRQLIADHKKQYGAFKTLDTTELKSPTLSTVVASYERADIVMTLSVDAKSGLIDGLVITEIRQHDTSFGSITKDVQALHGTAAFTIVRLDANDPAPLASHNADRTMAIGSAFKLYILAALADEVAAKRLRWDQVVPIGPASLPSGVTQNWPAGTKATIESLAILMISISDNTATDTLIRLVGRDKIERKMAALGHKDLARGIPFLTTYEAFALKMPGSQELLIRWNAADAKGRSELLKDEAAKISATTLDAGQFSNVPRAIDTVEWFASPNDIATALAALGNSRDPKVKAILAVNAGTTPTRRAALAYIGYKGGSEPGVLSLNFLITSKSGKNYAIAISWNDSTAPVELATLMRLAERMIDNIAAE